MKKIIIVVYCFFTSLLMHAQVPGYQGKRGVFEVQVAPSFIGLLEEGTGFPITYKLHGEYAIRRKKSLGIEYRQMSIGGNSDERYSNQTLMFLYTKYNRDWALAPNGHYFSYGLGYNMHTLKGIGENVDTSELKTNFFSFQMCWGQRYIIGKRLALNYGFETGFPINSGEQSRTDWIFMGFNLNLGLGFIF